jgi:hypothetical protein
MKLPYKVNLAEFFAGGQTRGNQCAKTWAGPRAGWACPVIFFRPISLPICGKSKRDRPPSPIAGAEMCRFSWPPELFFIKNQVLKQNIK